MTQAETEVGQRSDEVYPTTRWLAAVVVPFLVIAFVILLGWPGSTERLFAWTITPPLTAMTLGSAYLGSTYFFLTVVRERRWHRVSAGFPPATVFVFLLGIATILHWDRFHHGHVAFITWVTLYFTTPFLFVAAWARNGRTDPGPLDEVRDRAIPRGLRFAMGAIGAATSAAAALLFIRPELLIPLWPWMLTPLTARVVAALFALQGVIGLELAFDARWSRTRIPARTALIILGAVAVSTVVRSADLDPAKPLTWVYVVGLAVLLIFWAVLGSLNPDRAAD